MIGWDRMKSYEGKTVTVVLSRDPRSTVTGILRNLSDDGEVEIESELATIFAWPALDMECHD